MNVAVMAHPSREGMAYRLARQLACPIVWDEISSRWDTGRRAWLSLADNPKDWSMVIQDDAIPCRGFTVTKPWYQMPAGSPMVLYAGSTGKWNPIWRTVPRDTSFVVTDRIWWGPAIVMPTHLIREAIAFGDTLARDTDQYDHLLGAWFTNNQIPVYYTWPSLVDHHTGPSLIPERTAKRRAYRVSRNAAAENWEGPVHKVIAPRTTHPAVKLDT